MRKIELHDGTILKEGKKYKWLGLNPGILNEFGWKSKCEIVKICKDGIIFIHDLKDKQNYEYTLETLLSRSVKFKKYKKK